MVNYYLATCSALLLLLPVEVALAQAPVITSQEPLANARAIARTSVIKVGFSQPLLASSGQALKLFSNQRGGLRTRGTTPALVTGNTLSFNPLGYPFMPGETVQYTITQAATSQSGSLTKARTGQFTVAASKSGTGNYQLTSTLDAGYLPSGTTLGDVDSDGDLDLLIANYSPAGTVSIRLNQGNGTFGGNQAVSMGDTPRRVLAADMDSDGDLDLATISTGNISLPSAVSVRFNDGSGNFSGNQEVRVGVSPSDLTASDIDGDGDLDLLVPNGGYTPDAGIISILLNNGNGTFINGQDINAGPFPASIAAGDVDGDGDADILFAANANGTVKIFLNDGSGVFTSSESVAVSSPPSSIKLGDLDGDNDLDILTANIYSNSVSVRFNNGRGTFSGNQDVSVGGRPTYLVMSDVDGDSDLDFIVTNENDGTASVRLNDGSGTFSAGQEVNVGRYAGSIAAGDLDGDGDIDLTAIIGTGTAAIYLNQSQLLAATTSSIAAGFICFPNPAHGTTTITGLKPQGTCALLDALGRQLLTITADATGSAQLRLPAELPAGIYLVRYGSATYRLAVQ